MTPEEFAYLVSEVERLRNKVDGARGGGINNTSSSMSFKPAREKRVILPTKNISFLTIHVTSNTAINGAIRFSYSGTLGYWDMSNNTANGGTWVTLSNTTVKAFNSSEEINTFTGNGTIGTGNTAASANGTINGGSCAFLSLPNGYYPCQPRGPDSNGTMYYTIINAMNSAQ